MSDRFGIAVVGCGMAALPHARALKALENTLEVRGVYCRDPERRRQFAQRWGFPVASRAEDLAKDPDVHALLLLTPPNARRRWVELFASHGKSVLCEKPLERDWTAAAAIAKTCARYDVALGVVFQHRYRPASQRLADMLSSGSLGAVCAVNVDVPWWRPQSYYDEPGRGTMERDGGGVLISQAIHTIDLMLAFAGDVRSVQAFTGTTAFHRMESEDFAVAGLEFTNNAVGALTATTAGFPGGTESLRLHCTHASVGLRSDCLTVDWHDGRRDRFGSEAGTGGGSDPMDFPFDWHRALIADFIGAVRQGGAPKVSGADGLRVHRLIDAITRSSREGGRTRL